MNRIALALCLSLAVAGCSGDGDKDPKADGGADGSSADGGAQPVMARQDVLTACLRASACGVNTYPGLSNCLDAYIKLHVSQRVAPVYNKIYACVNAAKGDCDEVAKCFGRGAACDTSYKASCKGAVAVTCDLQDKRIYQLDCAAAGMECGIKKGYTFAAQCTPGECYSSFGEVCKGQQHYSCVGGLVEVRDCAAMGSKCGAAGKESAVCVGNLSESCDPKYFSASCSGSVAKTCVKNRENTFDCAKNTYLATKCDQGQCVVASSDCKGANRCAGDQLEACLDGKWVKYDCKALGLGACKPATTGAQCGKGS